MNDENQIVNILYRYAALIDMGRLEDAAALFVHARIKVHPGDAQDDGTIDGQQRSEEHTSELQSLMRISYAVFCLKNKTSNNKNTDPITTAHIQNTKKQRQLPIYTYVD